MKNLSSDYRKLLEPWIKSALADVFSPVDRKDLKYYGTGTNNWGAQTHQKGFSAFAVAASDPDTDFSIIGLSRDEMINIAVSMLRFTLESHKVGNYHCMDGDTVKWGHHWLSSLGVERMMHGVEAILDYLSNEDKILLNKLLVSESDWILENREIKAGLISPNVPESNLWSGALLHRTAMMVPDAPNVHHYRDKGTKFLLNSISIPSDAESGIIFEGRALKDWFCGANFFEDYALNHHHYLNIGYMIICLSNIAMLHFSYRNEGKRSPAALYNHMEHLWRLVRACLFDDGRLFRIGGDTRVRYCYCQDYIIPSLLMIRDCLGENSVERMEIGWINQVLKEIKYNSDGSFLSKRCELLVERSPLYYTRLESDRACTVSMGAYWHRKYGFTTCTGTGDYIVDPLHSKPIELWSNEYHGACFSRSEKRMTSFVWLAAEQPTALCVSPLDSSMAEWRNNMTSYTEGNGFSNHCNNIEHNVKIFQGGFITTGRYETVTSGFLEEQDNTNTNTINNIAFAALPDGRTIVNIQLSKAIRRCHLVKVTPLNLNIPNDVFNDFTRSYINEKNWLNIDNLLSVIVPYGGNLSLQQPGLRQIGMKTIGFPRFNLINSQAYQNRGFLCCDVVCIDPVEKPRWFEKDETIFDFGSVVVTHLSENETLEMTKYIRIPSVDNAENIRSIIVKGLDEIEYLIIANFSDKNQSVNIEGMTVKISSYSADVILIKT